MKQMNVCSMEAIQTLGAVIMRDTGGNGLVSITLSANSFDRLRRNLLPYETFDSRSCSHSCSSSCIQVEIWTPAGLTIIKREEEP